LKVVGVAPLNQVEYAIWFFANFIVENFG